MEIISKIENDDFDDVACLGTQLQVICLKFGSFDGIIILEKHGIIDKENLKKTIDFVCCAYHLDCWNITYEKGYQKICYDVEDDNHEPKALLKILKWAKEKYGLLPSQEGLEKAISFRH